MNKHILHVSGTHCPSCKILIEDILTEQGYVSSAVVDLKKETIEIESDQSQEYLVMNLTEKIKQNGYTLSASRLSQQKKESQKIIWTALPLGILFLILFFVLQKSGILNFGIGGEVTPSTSFIIGLVASVSSCLAIVGGLILSLSAKVSKDNISDKKNMVLFHVGRLGSFVLLGGMLGALGGVIGVNFTLSSILGILSTIVMIILGLDLMGLLNKNKVTLPSGIYKFFRKIEHRTLTPILIGFGTFFLPCGFTQSMQIVALSSGSFISGALIMGSFAVGTLPVLALLSFGPARFSRSKQSSLFFKTSGVVVVGLGLFGLLGALASLGIISPLFNI